MSSQLEARVLMLERQLAALSQRRQMPFALARSTMDVNDTGVVQTVQARLDALSVADAIPILYHHGFFSAPPVGADLHVAFLDLDRAKGIVVASNHQSFRMTGAAPGDAGLYAQGCLFHLTAGGILVTGNVTHTGNYTLNGDLHVTGAVIAGYGGSDQVGLQTHTSTASTVKPTAGT